MRFWRLSVAFNGPTFLSCCGWITKREATGLIYWEQGEVIMASIPKSVLTRTIELYFVPGSSWNDIEKQLRADGIHWRIKSIQKKLLSTPIFDLPHGIVRCSACKNLYHRHTPAKQQALCPECKRQGKTIPRWRNVTKPKHDTLSQDWLRRPL